MSTRHRNSKPRTFTREPREQRKARQRHVRRLARQALHVTAVAGDADLVVDVAEDQVLPVTVRTVVDPDPDVLGGPGRRRERFKVWKTKMWKRRNLERRQRARIEQQMLTRV